MDDDRKKSQSKVKIEKMVDSSFEMNYAEAKEKLRLDLKTLRSDFSKKGTVESGAYLVESCKLTIASLKESVNKTINDVEELREKIRRKDSSIYWSVTEDCLQEKIRRVKPTLIVDVKTSTKSRLWNDHGISLSVNSQIEQSVSSIVHNARQKLLSLKSKAIVVEMKTPDDRLARGIPDVAIMMWFPSVPKSSQIVVDRAVEKYKLIEKAVKDVTGGRATVMKFDDPENIPQDRISSSIEEWLEKSVLVICDLEGNRPNVFYEFGYARASGANVLATKPANEEVDFHLTQWQMINYADLNDLKDQLDIKVKKCLEGFDLSNDIPDSKN